MLPAKSLRIVVLFHHRQASPRAKSTIGCDPCHHIERTTFCQACIGNPDTLLDLLQWMLRPSGVVPRQADHRVEKEVNGRVEALEATSKREPRQCSDVVSRGRCNCLWLDFFPIPIGEWFVGLVRRLSAQLVLVYLSMLPEHGPFSECNVRSVCDCSAMAG